MTPPPVEDTRPLHEPSHPPSARRRGGAGLAAGVLAASVLVGGGAGYGGAALWEAQHDGGTSSSGTGSDSTVPSGDEAADATPTGSTTEAGWVEQVAATVLPSVVKIDVSAPQGEASGSGIVLSEDGRVLTNNHVVETAAQEGELRVSFNDGGSAAAEILGTDPLTDTAVIQVQDVSGLDPATIGSSGELGVGEEVVAIGSPFGLESTVTSGIVSALDRPVNVAQQADGSSTTYPAIQTDAAINPGNSGGPLVNAQGEVVGINSSIRTAASGSPFGEGAAGSIGLGFAIPIDEVMPIVEQMSNGEEPTHARMGIRVTDAEGPDGATGAGVAAVSDGTAAAEAGLEKGDVIVRVDDTPVTGADSLVATIRSYRPGDTVSVTYVRDGEEQTTELELESDAG
ncbi:MAG TPA: trypsin-like peptidase domain-containing protein [Nocardioides sp.]